MTTITANNTKTNATRIRSNTLSYFKCIKLDSTKKAFNPAINSATVTVNDPKCIEVMPIVTNVRVKSTNSIFASDVYSIVCVVLLAIILN